MLAPAADFEAAVDASEGDSLASSDKLADSFAQLDGEAGFAEVDVAYVEGRFLVCGGQRA